MSTLRFKMVEAAINRKAINADAPKGRPSEYFGMNVFNREKMSRYLPKVTFDLLVAAIDSGKPITREIADSVAEGMKKWAMEMGATHYTHWFQPLTGGTAEKHDAFVEHDGMGGMVEEFSGKLLMQQEPDASSFPNGGIRNTFEARGYSAWDASSPAFIVDTTLCVPTVFIAYTGEALDFKVPLLRSINAIDKTATAVCKYFDSNVNKVTSFLGWEQEYFLVDEGLWAARPDMMLTGRTLMGHESAKNQQLEDHYFGAIPTRVMGFMKDLEHECWMLGIPVKTRHNEVAPNQFELAPIYEEMNIANDHNQLLMSVLKKVARRHFFRVILHEKPFKGVNGSGKHNNWSLGTNTGVNLLSPGKNSKDNLQFVTFLVNIMMAVHKHNGLLKASISSATNSHRLGANEAPPAIISVFLGKQISEVLDKLEVSKADDAIVFDEKCEFKMKGIDHLPELLLDNTDRNRTSPFAFTGNRFEFRAVGSSSNCAASMLVLNTAVAAQLAEFAAEVDKRISEGENKEKAVFKVVRRYIKESKVIRFDGNGYSDEWRQEAEKRGLDCETSAPIIFDQFNAPKTIEIFKTMGVMSEKELHSRSEVNWEMYTKKIQIEARVLGDLAMNHIIPVVSDYQSALLDKVYKMSKLYSAEKMEQLAKNDTQLIEMLSIHQNEIQSLVNELIEERKVANVIDNEREKAITYANNVAPLFDKIRFHIDTLEMVVDNQMWTLPKYRELLFIR